MGNARRGGREPREGRWFAEPRRAEEAHGLRSRERALLIALVVGAGFLIVGFASGSGAGGVEFVLAGAAGLLAYGGGLLVQGRAERRLRRRHPEDAAFRDRELGAGEYPVELVVFSERVPIGVDRGVAIVADGMLAFHGHATSFSLAARDVVLGPGVGGRDPYARLPDDALVLKTPGRDQVVRLIALEGYVEALATGVNRFLADARDTAEPRQWPPAVDYAEQRWAEARAREVDADRAGDLGTLLRSGATVDEETDAILERAHRALECGNSRAYARLQEAARERLARAKGRRTGGGNGR